MSRTLSQSQAGKGKSLFLSPFLGFLFLDFQILHFFVIFTGLLLVIQRGGAASRGAQAVGGVEAVAAAAVAVAAVRGASGGGRERDYTR